MRKILRAICVALLAPLVLLNPAWAANWKTNQQGEARGDVTTYVRDVSNSPVNAFKGIVEVKASVTSVLAVITAEDTFHEWIFQVKGAERLSEKERVEIHMRFNGIWPVSDRDVVLANTLSQNNESGSITLHSVNAEGVLEKQEGYVRIPALDNQFVITDIGDGWVRVQFETFIDLGGSVPVWLTNMVSTKAPLVTLQSLKVQLEKPRFANATRKDLPPLPGMDTLSLED